MSKSLGNVVEPVEYSEKYSKELLTLYMLSAFNIGNDGDYDRKEAILNFNAKMANNFGNLVNRVVVLTMKLGLENGLESVIDGNISNNMQEYVSSYNSSMNEFNLKDSLDNTFFFLDALNKFADDKQPWQTIKDEDKTETIETLYTLAE
jgi:methionyl-tRNA synthetase